MRLIGYLHDDSKFILNELMAPFVKHEMVKEEPQGGVSKKKKKQAPGVVPPGIHGHQAYTLKLDLNNSKWWKAGFDNNYLQEQLNNFLEVKQSELQGGNLDATMLDKTQIPIGVRAADQTIFSDLFQGPTPIKTDIRD